MLVKYSPYLDVPDDHWAFAKMPEGFIPKGTIRVLGIQTSKDALNINLFCKIDGTLPYENLEYETHSFISIPLVKFGELRMDEIKLKFKPSEIEGFIQIAKTSEDYDSVLLNIIDNKPIDLTTIPIIEYATYLSDTETLSSLIASSIALEIEYKALSHLVKSNNSNNHDLPELFNNDGSIKLAYSSSPKAEPTLFNTKVKKMAIPSMNSVIKKVDAGKKLNQPETLLYDTYSQYVTKFYGAYDDDAIYKSPEGADGVALESKLQELNGELKDVREEIMLTKASHEYLKVPLFEETTVVSADILINANTVPVDIEFNTLINT